MSQAKHHAHSTCIAHNAMSLGTDHSSLSIRSSS